ncbi:MAG TPA: ATP-dependent Clp endopeptidase proteolytic subunit ClpP [Bacteroidales bacterium]|nr:ATP-dependent Clp endopeptidase proteolytic subunit ClpP [Bacteroidales bacterium]
MAEKDDFKKYATRHIGLSSLAYQQYTSMVNNNSYISPTIIEERKLNVASMDVFSRLMMDRIIFLGLPIDDYVANIIQAQLLYLDSTDNEKDIQIYFNTPGGSVHAGLGIYDTMQYISADIATICTGMAASMGAVLLTAGSEGKRSALKHSRIMIHQPMGGAQGPASDIEITAREIVKLRKELYEIIASHSGNTYKKVEEDSDRDYWMTAEEAKDYGMIDEVLAKNKK